MNLAQTKAYMALLKQGWEYSGRDGLGRVVMEKRFTVIHTSYVGVGQERIALKRQFIDRDGTIVQDESL